MSLREDEAAGPDEWRSQGLVGLLVTLHPRRQVAFCPASSSSAAANKSLRPRSALVSLSLVPFNISLLIKHVFLLSEVFVIISKFV